MEKVAEAEKLDEPDELGAVHGTGGADTPAAPAANRPRVLMRAATVMSPCGVVNCKVLGPTGPLLTNRMREILTYGSVGGVGRKPGPYPAPNPAIAPQFHVGRRGRGVGDTASGATRYHERLHCMSSREVLGYGHEPSDEFGQSRRVG